MYLVALAILIVIISSTSYAIHSISIDLPSSLQLIDNHWTDGNVQFHSDHWNCWPPPLHSSCHCLVNFTCNNNQLVNADHDDNLLIWLRCFHLNTAEHSLLFKRFLQTSSRNLIESAHGDVTRCLSEQNEIIFPSQVPLRVDFSECSANIIIDSFDHASSHPNNNFYSLKSLSITHSNLNAIPTSISQHFDKLHSLNLTGNQLTDFDAEKMNISTDNKLQIIDLSNNQISSINLSRFASLKSVNLSQNVLSNLNANAIKPNEHFYELDLNIGNNPWNCSRDLEWLVNLVAAIVDHKNGNHLTDDPPINQMNNRVNLFHSNEPECNEPSEAKMFPFSVWKSVKESSICSTCSCYLKDKYARVGYRYVSINCTNRNLQSLPSHLPKNTKILDLSGNQIRNLNPLSKYHHGELSKWAHINKIILSDNLLESLDGLESIRSIVFLDISGNLLTEIPYHIVNKVLSSNKIDKFRIGNNPYVCDCNTVKLQKWLHNNYRIILDIKQVRCGDLRPDLLQNESFHLDQYPMIEQALQSEFLKQEILQINSVHLCPISDSMLDALDLINIILATSILLLIIKVVYDYMWQKRTGKLPRFFKLNV